jgi:peptidoglycan hydrolase CwlO-like protein
MRNDQFVDIMQTGFMGIVAIVLIYVVWRLDKAFDKAAERLRKVITHQQEIQEGFERIWKRVDEIETQQGTRQTVMPLGKLQEQLTQMSARIKALELSIRQ